MLIQKSTREGFGLTVSEAIWKARPFIGGDVGGIPLQIEDGVTGFLVSSAEQCAERTLEILRDPGLGKMLGRRGKEHVREHFLTPRYLRDYLRIFNELQRSMTGEPAQRTPLVLVSNRGPVTFHAGGEVQRGSGGLVTALTGLASHREAIWIASAMSEYDAEVSREHGGRAFPVRSPAGGEYQVRLVVSDPDAYDRFYNVFANPMLWFIQHYLWDLSNAPDIRREEIEAFEFGYNVVNEDLARAVVEELEGADGAGRDGPRLPPLHAPGPRPPRAPGRVPAPLHPHPVDPAGRLAGAAHADPRGDLHGPAGERHHRLPHPLLPPQLPAVLPRPDGARRRLRARRRALRRARGVGARLSAADRPRGDPPDRPAASASSGSSEELLRRRRDFLILRVDRADLSKNVLRGFSAFDLFLEQHPEFTERVTFIAQLMPSRTDVPQYAEYLERIEALVAVVNHRHGTPDWMPIQLKLRDDLEEAMAAYKHYDVLLVNAMFDGMNLVAKEGPIVNEREGVSILSENTGAHEELGEYALSVNPFDIQELADSIYAALTMDARRAPPPRRGARRDRHLARSRRLDRRAARGHPREGPRGLTGHRRDRPGSMGAPADDRRNPLLFLRPS